MPTNGTLALTLSRGLHVVAMLTGSGLLVVACALMGVACGPHRRISKNRRLGWGVVTHFWAPGGATCLGGCLVYIAQHICIRVVCSFTTHVPRDMCRPEVVIVSPLGFPIRVPIVTVLPTAYPWHSRKQTFDGLPGFGPCSSPSSIPLSQKSLPVRRYPAVGTNSKVDGVTTWTSALLPISANIEP